VTKTQFRQPRLNRTNSPQQDQIEPWSRPTLPSPVYSNQYATAIGVPGVRLFTAPEQARHHSGNEQFSMNGMGEGDRAAPYPKRRRRF